MKGSLENCLRLDINEDECVGEPALDLPMVFDGVNTRTVGKAISQCVAKVSH